MRYLRTQSLNNRAIFDRRFYLGLDNSVNINSTSTLTIPVGTTDQRPLSPTNGMLRYNTTINNLEVYQGSTWRGMRFKEASAITQQTIGYGDGTAILFGPLNPAPPLVVASGESWGGQNLIVLIENVFQLHTTNYTVVQNPNVSSKSYTGRVSQTNNSTRVYFNTAISCTNAQTAGSLVTVGFADLGFVPFSPNSLIVVENFIPARYNGIFPVVEVGTAHVKYEATIYDGFEYPGTIASTDAIYPVNSLIGATVVGGLWTSTIVSYELDEVTGAVLYVDLANSVQSVANAEITITTAATQQTGYYLNFNAPVPNGKMVTVLHGFDS